MILLVRKKRDWPEKDELVMCTVKEVFNQGAYLVLDEYGGKEGMVHISEIASGWVKNIRRHVKEGQKTVCRVLNVDKDKEHIDLSIRRVKDSQRSWKSDQWKREKKAENLLDQASKRIGEDKDTAYDKIGFPLQEEYGGIYDAFEEVATKGREILEENLEADEEWIDALMDLIDSSVEPPTVEVKGFVDLKTNAPEGIKVISNALQQGRDSIDDPEVKIDVSYVGSPTYSFRVEAPTYKKAEKVLREAAEKSISVVEGEGGSGEFYTEKE